MAHKAGIPSTVSEISDILASCDVAAFEQMQAALAADPRKGVQAALERCRRRFQDEACEQERLEGLYSYGADLAPIECSMGLDEVGRGPLAGPLCVGAVVLPDTPRILGLNDSKKLSEARRRELAAQIKSCALAQCVISVEPAQIDEWGITQALSHAFADAIAEIDRQLAVLGRVGCQAVFLDGNPLYLDKREHAVIKGDAKVASIAAASILAKVHRDAYMMKLAEEFPCYAFENNKGYGSAEHIKALKRFGLSRHHRKSFCSNFFERPLF